MQLSACAMPIESRARRPEVVIDDDDDDDMENGGACAACCRRCGVCFRSSALTLFILVGMATGLGIGVVLRSVPPFDEPLIKTRPLAYLSVPGQLVSRLSAFLTVPLIVASLLTGSGSMRSACAQVKVTVRTLTYDLLTTILAAGEGLAFVYAIRPGNRNLERRLLDVRDSDSHGRVPDATDDCNPIDALLDILRNLIPENIVTSFLYLHATNTSFVSVQAPNGTAVGAESFGLQKVEATNVLGITFVAVIFGLALAKLGDKGRIMQLFFNGLCESILTIVRGLLWLLPVVAVFSMMHTVISLVDPLSQLMTMFMFGLTVLLGLFTHMFLVLPIIYVVFTRRNPFRLLYYVFRALLVGFITDSSMFALPVTIDCLEQAGIDARVTRWVCPVGASVNNDGYALYQAMACVFIATARDITFSASTIAILGFTTVALSAVDPASPANWPVFVIFFKMIGLPPEDLYLLLPFDWMLSRFRTVVNIWSDSVCSGIVDKCSQSDLVRNESGHRDERGCVGLDQSRDGAVLTGYSKRKDWTVRLVNPYGDRMVVSKV